MVFLVDFENVKNDGMRGTRFLKESDTVILFVSKNAENIQKRYLMDIEKSGCELDICKLINIGKNALDFYITSKLGEIVGKGCPDQIAIISRDKGFMAVRDFWSSRTTAKKGIVLAPRIEDAMLQISDPHDMRRADLADMRRSVSISEYFAAYSERKRIESILVKVFGNTECSGFIREIMRMIQNEYSPKEMYLESLKRFGRTKGLYIYRKVKSQGDELIRISC